MLDKSMPVFSNMPSLFQTFSLTLNQMHVVVFSESVFHIGNLLYQPDILFSAFLHFICCTLSVGPQLVPRTLKHKSKKKVMNWGHPDSCLVGPRRYPEQ